MYSHTYLSQGVFYFILKKIASRNKIPFRNYSSFPFVSSDVYPLNKTVQKVRFTIRNIKPLATLHHLNIILRLKSQAQELAPEYIGQLAYIQDMKYKNFS